MTGLTDRSRGVFYGWWMVGVAVFTLTLMSLSVFGALITIFVGTRLIYNEIDKRTIYVVLSRPVARWQYLVGKYFGLLLTVLTMIGAMSLFFLGYLAFMSSSLVAQEPSAVMTGYVTVPFGPVVFAIAMTLLEMLLLTAMAIAFSAASTPILSAIFTFLAYVLGHQADNIKDLANIVLNPHTGVGSKFLHDLIMFLYYIMPNLSVFNVRNEVAHGLTPDYTWGLTFGVVVYGLGYSALCLLLGILAFRRRNF